jgi:adenylate cyclase
MTPPSITVPPPAVSTSVPLPRVRFPLAQKLALAFGLLSVIPLLATGLYVVDINRRVVRELQQHLQGAVSDELARGMGEQLIDAEDALDDIGRILVDPSLSPEVTERLALSRLAADSALDHVSVYRPDGTLLVVLAESEGEATVRPPETLDLSLREIAERRDAASGGVRRTPEGPGLLVVVPVRGAEAEDVTGYVASVVRMGQLDEEIVELRERHFPTVLGALLVTDDTGAVLSASNPADAASDVRPAVFDTVDPHAEAAWSGRFTDASGEDQLAEVRYLPGRPLRVVVQVPVSIAFASLIDMQWAVGIAVLVAMLFSVVVGMLVARGLTRPIARLVELAKDLGARRWDRKTVIESSDELSILGAAMGGAASDLLLSEEAMKKEIAIRADLGRYIPQEIVERVVRREQDMALGGARREISVLFADVVGFTPLTTRLSPEDTVTILNELFTILTEIVFRHGGTVDKFIGDSVMAIFGAPSDQPDHAERALRTAEDMLRFLETGNATWQERFGVTIQLAIGVNTGEAVVGNIGSETRIEYTAIGDTVNVAARLEAIARPQQILITQATKDAAGEGFDYFDGGAQELPGRAGAVHLWEVAL